MRMKNKAQTKSRFFKDFYKNRELTLLALPCIIVIFIFCYVPLYGLIIPFKDYTYSKGLLGSPWVGLKNFEFLFTSDQLFTITRNTLGYNFLFIVTTLFLSVFLAILLNEISRKFVKLYQTAIFFPYFVSWVVVSYAVYGFLDMDNGLLNSIFKAIGISPVMWYAEPKYWPFFILLANLWKNIGVNVLIYYAALIGMDPEYYESAKIDGATKFQRDIYISVPLLKPLIIILSILAIGRVFYSDFGLFYNLPMDQPMLYPATQVIDTYVFMAIRSLGDFGMAAAAGFYQSVCGFVLVLVTNLVVRKVDNENRLF